MPLNVKSALICDGAREEKTGKFILVGVYTGDVIFLSKPATFSPVFWVEIVAFVKDSVMEIEAKIDIPGRFKSISFTATTPVEQQDRALFIVQARPFKIAEGGSLRLSMRPAGTRRWTEIITKTVLFAESSGPSFIT